MCVVPLSLSLRCQLFEEADEDRAGDVFDFVRGDFVGEDALDDFFGLGHIAFRRDGELLGLFEVAGGHGLGKEDDGQFDVHRRHGVVVACGCGLVGRRGRWRLGFVEQRTLEFFGLLVEAFALAFFLVIDRSDFERFDLVARRWDVNRLVAGRALATLAGAFIGGANGGAAVVAFEFDRHCGPLSCSYGDGQAALILVAVPGAEQQPHRHLSKR